MSRIKSWLINVVRLLQTVKEEHLRWQLASHGWQAELETTRALQEQALAAQLQKKAAELAHDLALLKTQHDTELTLFKIRCQQDIQDYKQYLEALAQLKQAIQNSYPHLPAAVAFTIHHHAKQLLNQMWEEQDFRQKMFLEMQLIQFMTAVHEDARLRPNISDNKNPRLPTKTLDLLQS